MELLRHHDGTKFEKTPKNSKISNFLAFPRDEMPTQANNNREAVVVCARHVVKRPSKRSVLVSLLLKRN